MFTIPVHKVCTLAHNSRICRLSCPQLERLQQEHDTAVAAMQKQKADAKRWLHRQQVRLQAQAIEVQWERAAIGEILMEDYRQLMQLTSALDAAERQ